MKNIYRSRGKIHPSPPPAALHLSLLPAAILTLTAALTAEDKEVLSYLLTTSNNFSGHHSGGDHRPIFQCDCFRCYTSYWARWDTSPNRQLIHEILDAYEDELIDQNNNKKKKKKTTKKRKNKNNMTVRREGLGGQESDGEKGDSAESESVDSAESELVGTSRVGEMGLEKGSMRKLVSFIGERIWGAWGM